MMQRYIDLLKSLPFVLLTVAAFTALLVHLILVSKAFQSNGQGATTHIGRRQHGLLVGDHVSMAVFVVCISLAFAHIPVFQDFIQEQLLEAYHALVSTEKPPHFPDASGLARRAILSTATTLNGAPSESLYSLLEQKFFPMLQGPTREAMRIDFDFKAADNPDLLSVTSTLAWSYRISEDSTEDPYSFVQPVHYYAARAESEVPEELISGSIEIGGRRRRLTMKRLAEGPPQCYSTSRGVECEDHYYGEEPVSIRKGKGTHVQLQFVHVIPITDVRTVNFVHPTNGFDVIVRWNPPNLIVNPRLDVFTLGLHGDKPRQTGTTEPGSDIMSWHVEGWVLPNCGAILTWQQPRPR